MTLDIGNSRIKSALFGPSADLVETKTWTSGSWRELTDYSTNHSTTFVIYSTVADEPPTSWSELLAKKGISLKPLTHLSPLPFESQYRTMDTLGRDRIAALAGAIELLPGTNCLIADMGTCLTLDLLIQSEDKLASSEMESNSGKAVFMGGNISPGLHMRLRAMHRDTKRLPMIEARPLDDMLGLDTSSALLHGGLGGMIYEIEGLFDRLSSNFTDLRLLITGGDARLVQKHLKPASLLQPHLVHYGLYQISTLYAA